MVIIMRKRGDSLTERLIRIKERVKERKET